MGTDCYNAGLRRNNQKIIKMSKMQSKIKTERWFDQFCDIKSKENQTENLDLTMFPMLMTGT